MRVFVLLLLVRGIVPGLPELGEAVVHYVRAGHIAHTSADKGDLGDQGAEHGCGTTLHTCTCCPTQSMAQPGNVVVGALRSGFSAPVPAGEVTIGLGEPARPFRPPIS